MLRPFQLADLALTLTHHDFVVGTHQTLAAARLLAQLPGPVADDDLALWLAPVFCSTAQQQRAFPGIVADWARIALAPAPPKQDIGNHGPGGGDVAIADPLPWRLRASAFARKHAAALLLLLALALAGAVGALRLIDRDGDAGAGAGGATAAGSTTVPAEPAGAAQATAPQPEASVASSAGLQAALAAAACLPLLAWLLLASRRRGFLERQPARQDHVALHLRGAQIAAMKSWRGELAFLGRVLRRRVTVSSPELDVPATVAHYARTGMPSRLFFGSRHEPEYLVLIDSAGAVDHFARIAEELVATLHRDTDVNVEVFVFQSDPRLLRHLSLQPGRVSGAPAVSLDGLVGRFPQSRMLVFSDGRELISPMSGQPVAWLPMLLRWPHVALITPRPRAQWSVREDMLLKAGLDIVPLDSAGLVLLGEILTAQQGMRPAATPADARATPVYLRDLAGLLDTVAPPLSEEGGLLAALRRDLGPRGFVWLCACAIYPEIQWGLTLTLGRALLKEERERADLLVTLSALPWLRRGYMPDWLREQLLDALDADDAAVARQAIAAYLARVADGVEPAADADDIQIGHTPQRGFWRDVGAGLAAMLRARPAPAVREDRVYLRFMCGKPAQLAVSAGDRIAQLFVQHGAAFGQPRKLPYLLASAVLASASISAMYGGGESRREEARTAAASTPPALPAGEGDPAASDAAADKAGALASSDEKPSLLPAAAAVGTARAPSDAPSAAAAAADAAATAAAADATAAASVAASRDDGRSALPSSPTARAPYPPEVIAAMRDAQGMQVQDGRAAASNEAGRAIIANEARAAADNAERAAVGGEGGAAANGKAGLPAGSAPISDGSAPAASSYTVRFTSTPTGRRTSYGPEFTFGFSLSGPEERIRQIRQVVYYMDDPTFKQKEYRSVEASSGFAQSYTGWGCLRRVGVTINYRDGASQQFTVDMCAALNKSPELEGPSDSLYRTGRDDATGQAQAK
jgi:hypothetical protein